ncbi:phage portal protein [Pseudochelatococcus sp. B33]
MRLFGWARQKEERAATIENPTVPVSSENFLAFFGVGSAGLPHVTIDTALTVPAVLAAVAFLSRTLAAIPLHAYRDGKDGSERLKGKTAVTVHEFANDEMSSFKFRQYFWQQVFTGGRGLAYIERKGREIEAIWPLDPRKVSISRQGMRLTYKHDGQVYQSRDVIDVPFMLQEDQTRHYGPIAKAAKAIQLAIAMNNYGSTFFSGGGVPPLALVGPLPQGAEGLKRAMIDISRSIEAAKSSSKSVFPIPPGHELKQVGFDPAKGQMTEAKRAQVEEIARVYQLPPVFLQDLSRATFSNAEQQDLHLVKHLIGQWAKAFESEMTLKLFGRASTDRRFVEHNLDGLMRGDFKSRIEGIARGIMTGQMTPNEGRLLENRPRHPNPAADELLVQGATVVLGSAPAATVSAGMGHNGGPPLNEPNGQSEVDERDGDRNADEQ